MTDRSRAAWASSDTSAGAEPSPPYGGPMEVDIAAAARLVAEPARAAMLEALTSGQSLPAGDLARAAGVSPATASEHLARLRHGGFVTVVTTGRHRYYRLASVDVAHALEALAMVSPARPVRSLRQSRLDAATAFARTCYDHLAGTAGVAVHDALVSGGAVLVGVDGYQLSADGEHRLARFGVDADAARRSSRSFARTCVDLTERRPHLAGALGAVLCGRMLALGWFVRRARGQRAVLLTDEGRRGLARHLDVDLGGASGRPSDSGMADRQRRMGSEP
jgi:DNA-binding transcriptional ArsR family regulator